MKYFSLFSGIGGFELGIGDKATCIGYSEVDKYAIQIYEQHFKTHRNYGDITTIDAAGLPDFDLICGGFPCQSFSVAGRRRGFEDTRGTLFFDIARLITAKRPRLLFLENVKGLLSHCEGETFSTIIRTLDELGYDLGWQVCNSRDFGVPQNRERVFIIGHSRDTPRPQVFPFGGDDQANPQERVGEAQNASSTLQAGYGKAHGGDTYITDTPVVIESRVKHGKQPYPMPHSPALSAHWGTGGNNVPVVSRQPLRFLDRNQKNIEGDYAFTVDSSQTSGVRVDQRIRRLTPIECERLQGFPDNWTEGISDTQRYKCLGNAVTVNVIRAIAERLL